MQNGEALRDEVRILQRDVIEHFPAGPTLRACDVFDHSHEESDADVARVLSKSWTQIDLAALVKNDDIDKPVCLGLSSTAFVHALPAYLSYFCAGWLSAEDDYRFFEEMACFVRCLKQYPRASRARATVLGTLTAPQKNSIARFLDLNIQMNPADGDDARSALKDFWAIK